MKSICGIKLWSSLMAHWGARPQGEPPLQCEFPTQNQHLTARHWCEEGGWNSAGGLGWRNWCWGNWRELFEGTFWDFSSCEDWLWSTVFRDGLWSYNEILVWWKVGIFGLWDLMTLRWWRLHGPPVMTVKLWSGWPRSQNLSEFPGRSKRQCLRSSTGKSPERRELWRRKMVEMGPMFGWSSWSSYWNRTFFRLKPPLLDFPPGLPRCLSCLDLSECSCVGCRLQVSQGYVPQWKCFSMGTKKGCSLCFMIQYSTVIINNPLINHIQCTINHH